MITIPYADIQQAAAALADGIEFVLGPDITARLHGGHVYIYEGQLPVFHMEAYTGEDLLQLEYPRTADEDLQRGWGKVGGALALEYGLAKGCTRVKVVTLVEGTRAATSYWHMVRVQTTARPIADVIADLNVGANLQVVPPAAPKGRARSSSFGGRRNN